MRVLHVISGLDAGGAEHQLRLLLRHQRSTAEVAALTNAGVVARAMRTEGTTVHEIEMRTNTDITALPRLVRLIRTGHFDVVHTHLYRAGIYGRVASRLAGVRRVIATEHSLCDRVIEGRRISYGVRALYRAAERLGHTTIAVSGSVARRLSAWGIPTERVEVIPNGIEAGEFTFDPSVREEVRARLGIPADRYVVGSVARLVPSKRIDVVLRATHDQPATVLVVGDGPQRSRLTALARALGVETRFVGESTDVPALLSAMDILVAPSLAETFGLGVVEGLAAGLPVLYTTCPALEELPPGAAPGARRLRGVEAFRGALAAAVHEGPRRRPPPPALDHYDIARLAPRVDALYARAAGVARTGRARLEGS
jgi:glycosyltransferase involved in cell wall biosynthesis